MMMMMIALIFSLEKRGQMSVLVTIYTVNVCKADSTRTSVADAPYCAAASIAQLVHVVSRTAAEKKFRSYMPWA